MLLGRMTAKCRKGVSEGFLSIMTTLESGTEKPSVALNVIQPIQVEAPPPPGTSEVPFKSHHLDTSMFRIDGGHAYVLDVPPTLFTKDELPFGNTDYALLENGQMLGPIVSSHDAIRKWGLGRYSPFNSPENNLLSIYFSASDNSDPRSNGRSYTLVNQPMSYANNWRRLQTRGWESHSRFRYFMKRGGDRVAAPLYANMGISDICNLQCGICGSQNMLQPVNRRHMDFHIFERVAETLFPLLTTVEFNSRGEPLLHPQIAEMFTIIADYGIYLRLQTNGTQFVGRKLRNLLKVRGDVSISIDATESIFEYARTNAKWDQVDKGIRALLQRRDPNRISVSLYPTLTALTIKDAPNLIRWAMEIGINKIDFHAYDPIESSTEQVPSPEALAELKDFAAAQDASHPIEIRVSYEPVKVGAKSPVDRPAQEHFINLPRKLELEGSHPDFVCMAPHQLVDIDLDGCISACCLLQSRKLGNALTAEAFADCWFGAEYQALRNSMQRGPKQYGMYEECRDCIKCYCD